MKAPKKEIVPFTPYQKFVVGILAFLQFTIILDFMLLSPLGAQLMPALKINTTQFGLVVSAYAFSAGASGLLASGFADRFDRKKMLLFFYAGFLIGTFLCGIASTYEFLLAARIVTGLFGGVIGSVLLAITTDLFSFDMRGRVMGIVQTAFAGSQVLGIPFGLYLSSIWNWNAPFLLIVGVGLIVGVVIVLKLQPINGHLAHQSKRGPFAHMTHILSQRRYLQGFATTILLSTGGFMLMPFGSSFTVNNLKIAYADLPMIYMITGLFSIFTGPIIGRLSDRVGKLPVFMAGSTIMALTVLYYTNMSATTIYVVVIVNVIMFVGVFGRMIPSTALMSALPTPQDRGAYMSISSSIQQISGGIAAAVAGLIVTQAADQSLVHFDRLGYVVVGTSVITMTMMVFLNRMIEAGVKH